ncbi:MAG: Cyclic di-GMP phosphodiesterase response regulator RpfG [Candidatus Dichloromethanomonas elyunquensis]|nr:MAG: Cyclic di-GMP phosphodiesterase response regulator RpfG [Candidatus Dichloromethanomonas elyunquensis]
MDQEFRQDGFDKENRYLAGVQVILDSLPFYVILVNEDHRIVLANKAVQKVLRIENELQQVIGGYCPKVIHGSDGPVPYCPLEQSLKEGKSVEHEFFDDGLGRWVCSMIHPIHEMTHHGKKLFFHMLQDIDEKKRTEEELLRTISKFHGMTQSVIKAITITVEKRDPYTAGHQQRVSRLGVEIAKEMGLSQEETMGIQVAGLVHDIGKIAVPIEILSKPGKITFHEYHLIKAHSEIGYEILKEIEFPWPVAETILQHHEKIDGSGYPFGLKGHGIRLEARVLCVADAVEAMSSHRPYRQAHGIDFVIREITGQQGILYDKNAVEACLKAIEKGFQFES